MRRSSLARAMEAMASMEKGRPYALRPEDGKRRLTDQLARFCREEGVEPVVIGGLAVNHHGYMRVTADVNILVSREEAVPLYRRLRSETGWRRHAEGFKNTIVGVGLDICVEGERTSPGSTEEFPSPAALKKVRVRPLPVPALSELIALKVMSGRARDDADVVELLKRHHARMAALRRAASKQLRTREARARLAALLARARQEAARRRP
ncbi:MAG TPA: hypothetical protein VLI67_04685 [Vicinamibacteria bacterium]|nr:hypothetical protein [Vicinamibacteria bacterium]